MLEKWKSLGTIWKVVIIAGFIVLAVIVYDLTLSGTSSIKSWMNDRAYAERMEQVEKLTKEIEVLRAEKKEYERQAMEAEAKEAIFKEREKNLDAKTKAELQKLEEALAQQDKEDAVTAQETDSFTRCERMKAKMVSLNIKSAGEINCAEYKN